MISQVGGIGDILFIQKIIRYYADLGFHVVIPILDTHGWMTYYLPQHPDVEYPLIATNGPELTGSFRFSDAFFSLGAASCDLENPDSAIFKSQVAYENADPEKGFVFLALASCYKWLQDRMMSSKYNYVGLDFKDWADYAKLKRRPHVEKELYYDVLGLTDRSSFTLVNENASSRSLEIDIPGDVVKLEEKEGFTLFDWSMVVEKAKQIVTIDTSLVLLIEILKLNKPLYMLSRSIPPSFDSVDDILCLDWTLVPTVADLDIRPVSSKPTKWRFVQAG